jgi:hypothetical protein
VTAPATPAVVIAPTVFHSPLAIRAPQKSAPEEKPVIAFPFMNQSRDLPLRDASVLSYQG